jgi:hypothetical protein
METYMLLCTHLKRNSLNICGNEKDVFSRSYGDESNTLSVSSVLYLSVTVLELICRNRGEMD